MARRIVTVPFTYELAYRVPGGRKPRDAYVRDELDVAIRELDGTDFPVAARFADGQNTRHSQVDELRHDGLRFYRPLVEETPFGRKPVMADVLEHLTHLSDRGGPFQGATGTKTPGRDAIDRAEVVGTRLGDSRAEVVRAIQDKAASTVICGGQLFVACGEPCFRYVDRGYGASYLRAELVDVANPAAPETLVRADGLAQWHALTFPPDEHPDGAPEVGVYGTLEVLMPATLRLSVAGPALRLAASRFVEFAEHRLAQVTVADFAAYAGLRDALSRNPRTVDENMLTAVDAVLGMEHWSGIAASVQLAARRMAWRQEMLEERPPHPLQSLRR